MKRLAMLLLLAGCGGSSDTPPEPPSTECSAVIMWESPTEMVDGTPITPADLSKFTIYMTDEPDPDGQFRELEVDITDTFLIAWEIRNISSGTHYFYMTATSKEDHTSAFSNVESLTC